MEIHALSGLRGPYRGPLRGLGAVDMCSDRAMMAQTIITMASSALAAYGKGEEQKSTAAVGAAITGATQQWMQRCAAAGASASELAAAQAQLELQKAQIELQVQQLAAQQAKENADRKAKQQQVLIGLGVVGFLGALFVLKRD